MRGEERGEEGKWGGEERPGEGSRGMEVGREEHARERRKYMGGEDWEGNTKRGRKKKMKTVYTLETLGSSVAA